MAPRNITRQNAIRTVEWHYVESARRLRVDTGSTVVRRQLGRYLRDLREGAGIKVSVVAKALDWSTPRIWRYETGQVPMAQTDVEALCRFYGASDETTELLKSLARETKARGWWHSYADAVPEWFRLFVGLEGAAVRIRNYQPNLIPGLLQTVAYMSEVMALDLPQLDATERQAKVSVRMQRQALLARALPPAPQYDVIVSEAVLRRPLRDRQAMAQQLHYLTSAADRANVTVRVIPLAAGLHSWAAAGAFTVLDFPREGVRDPEPTTVYADGPAGAFYLDKPNEVDFYELAWASLNDLAMNVRDSRQLISDIAEGYGNNE
jgi:transcriptional regulator with XRE-family HTH domain